MDNEKNIDYCITYISKFNLASPIKFDLDVVASV